MFRKWISLFLTGMMLFILCACTNSNTALLPQKTPLTVLGTLGGDLEPELIEARVVLSRGKHVVEEVVPLQDNEFQATLQMPVGQWDLTVLLIDTDGMVRFQNSPQLTEVSLDQPNIVELVLRPADSKVQVQIELENYIFAKQALRARIHFDDEVHEVTRKNSQTPLAKEIGLAPGSYEFKIELYTESFRAGDRLGVGLWDILTVPANESLTVVWSPPTDLVQITGRLELIPTAPANMQINPTESGIQLTWDPVLTTDIDGYLLLVQESPLERFQLINSIPVQETSFLFDFDDPNEQPEELLFIVAAVSSNGSIGFYSPPILWSQP